MASTKIPPDLQTRALGLMAARSVETMFSPRLTRELKLKGRWCAELRGECARRRASPLRGDGSARPPGSASCASGVAGGRLHVLK